MWWCHRLHVIDVWHCGPDNVMVSQITCDRCVTPSLLRLVARVDTCSSTCLHNKVSFDISQNKQNRSKTEPAETEEAAIEPCVPCSTSLKSNSKHGSMILHIGFCGRQTIYLQVPRKRDSSRIDSYPNQYTLYILVKNILLVWTAINTAVSSFSHTCWYIVCLPQNPKWRIMEPCLLLLSKS